MGRPRTARLGGAVLTAALAAALLTSTAPVAGAADPADRKRQVDASIDDLREALEGTSADLEAAAVALQQTQTRLPIAQAELAKAQATEAEARAKDAELAGRLAAATESEAKATEALDSGQAEIEQTHRQLGRIAAQAYRGGSLDQGLAVALNAESPADFATRYVMVDTALRSQNGALARLAEQQALRAHAEARLEAVRVEIDKLKAEAARNLEIAKKAAADAAARKAEIEQLLAQQKQALAVIEARKADEMRRLDQLEAERTKLEAELRRIAEERRRAAEAARRKAAASRGGGRSAPPSRGGALSWPVSSVHVTSGYGYRIHPIYHTRRLHAGTDFRAHCGTPILAAADGTVISAGWAGGYGNRIVVDNGVLRGQSVATSYNHLSRYAVRGGHVRRGQVLGYSGTTGSSTACHLHFEVYVNGSTTDPMGWL
jgi:murein DD-endopeptidase MepM/ murein hydrolase activator NlpD